MDYSDDSDCELVIDESIILSDDEEKTSEASAVKMAGDDWDIFDPGSISSSDIKHELFNDETNTCSICKETFRYNIGLICHLEMEHVELKLQSKKSTEKKSKKRSTKTVPKVVSLKPETNGTKKFSCYVCKKLFADHSKLLKHSETCSTKFKCVKCKSTFSWESKYKKHLFRVHKFEAVVICKQCSSVFEDSSALARHSLTCEKESSFDSFAAKPVSQQGYEQFFIHNLLYFLEEIQFKMYKVSI